MLKHVGPYRSTSSLVRSSSTSLRRPGDSSPTAPQKVLGGTDEDEDSVSSPECLRRSLSSPESCCTSDFSSPELMKRVLEPMEQRNDERTSHRQLSQHIISSPKSYMDDDTSNRDSLEDESSSPEIPKKDLARPSTLPRRGGHRNLDELSLKGDQVRQQSLRGVDSCSLHSTSSFSSLATSKLSSRSSSTSSLTDQSMVSTSFYFSNNGQYFGDKKLYRNTHDSH